VVPPADADYNELEYLKNLDLHNRIKAQAKKENVFDDYVGFELNARIEEINSIYKTLYNLIDRTLYNEIQSFRNALNGVAKEKFESWLRNIDGTNQAGYSVESISEAFTELQNYYQDWLDFYFKVYNGVIYNNDDGKYVESIQENG
jgi:hypothetical protein